MRGVLLHLFASLPRVTPLNAGVAMIVSPTGRRAR